MSEKKVNLNFTRGEPGPIFYPKINSYTDLESYKFKFSSARGGGGGGVHVAMKAVFESSTKLYEI